MEFDEESEPEVPIYNRAELIERYQVMVSSPSFEVLQYLFKKKHIFLTSFLLITVSQFNIFKDMYCHNICNLLMIITHLKKLQVQHEKGCQNNLEENYIELC